jgi:3-polyprenyl-4-hydroxybenzoate decarboxylase
MAALHNVTHIKMIHIMVSRSRQFFLLMNFGGCMKQARQAVKQTKNILYSNTKILITVAAQSGQRIKKLVIPRVLKTQNGCFADCFPSGYTSRNIAGSPS